MLRALPTTLSFLLGLSLAFAPLSLVAAQNDAHAPPEAGEASSEPPDRDDALFEPSAVESPSSADSTDASLAAQLEKRENLATIHRALGIATWASMAVTAVLGWIQFADEYGFHGDPSDTACANQTAVFNDFCTGVPWVHAISGFTTAALYFTTAGISLAMPAPLEASADLELHKNLRWAHLATMLATVAFGLVTANIDADFQTRQALALVHQGLGVTTFGLLTTAAAVVVF